jgi:UDP-GlcNAc:undecaprenyl-phosphate GlcNAc-1-phosphate transferase
VTGGWIEYTVIFLSSALLCTAFAPIAIRLSWRFGSLDKPGGHKSHESPVPYLGGLAIVLAFSIALLLESTIRPSEGVNSELRLILGTATVLAIIGFFDDRKSLSPWLRLVAEVGSGVMVWNLGAGVGLTGVTWVDLTLTVFWVVGITNAFNLLDNMDGLAAGMVLIACSVYFAIAAANSQFLVAGLSAGLAGCAVGFLRNNRYPARIYMGDGGALFLGFMVAYLGLKLKVSGDGYQTFLVPVLVCAIAILDTTLVTVARLMSGRSPFQGGQDHISHRLVTLGLPVPVAVGLIHSAAVCIGVLSFVCSRVDPISVWIIGGLVGLGLSAGGVLLWAVPVYPESQRPKFSFLRQTPAE